MRNRLYASCANGRKASRDAHQIVKVTGQLEFDSDKDRILFELSAEQPVQKRNMRLA